jgi:aryl-alcohol dehydrogenase-like predicted oxidoreductase
MTLRYRMLGGTGIEVSTYCLGTMMFGALDGTAAGNPDHDECVRIVHAALDRGINFVDTADMYSAGESEQIVGKALRGHRDDVVLSTKGHFPLTEGPARGGNSRRWIIRAVEDSLRRLQTDWIDLYQVHRPDESTAIEETLSALTDLTQQGKLRAFGCSTFPAHHIVAAHAAADRRGLMRFRAEQSPYSLLTRGIERFVLPVCQDSGMGVLTWSPLAWGFLSGKFRKGSVDLDSGRPLLDRGRFDPADPANAAKYEAVERLASLADKLDCSLPSLAFAFPLAHPAVSSVIIGPRTMEQLDRTLDGAPLGLDDATLDEIDQIVPPGTDVFEFTWTPRSLTDPVRRRLPLDARAAGQQAE